MDSVDLLLEMAALILAGATLPIVGADIEVAMDFLAERDDFMARIVEQAALIIGRPTFGPGDADFEQIMVRLMDAVQTRLDPAWFGGGTSTSVFRPNPASA